MTHCLFLLLALLPVSSLNTRYLLVNLTVSRDLKVPVQPPIQNEYNNVPTDSFNTDINNNEYNDYKLIRNGHIKLGLEENGFSLWKDVSHKGKDVQSNINDVNLREHI